MKRSKAFTLVELLVVIAIIALLISILVPTLARARELAKRVKCGASLKGIGSALGMYAAESKDATPILPDIVPNSAVTYTTNMRMGAECRATLASGGAASLGDTAVAVGAQQNLCLLVKYGSITWDMFLCASTDTRVADRSASAGTGRDYGLGEVVTGGGKKSYIDFGLQIPYAVTGGTGGGTNACPWSSKTDPGVAIMADLPPNDASAGWLATDNRLYEQFSPNHAGEGENILYMSSNVQWRTDKVEQTGSTPPVVYNTSGWGNNPIYTKDNWTGTKENPTLSGYTNTCGTPGVGTPKPEAASKDSVIYAWK